MKKGLKSGVFVAVLLSAVSSQVYALDCDGTITCAMGVASHGSFDITYFKGNHAKIWGLKDITLHDTNLASSPVKTEVCVFSNKDTGSNTYRLEVGSAHNFTLDDTSGTSNTPLAYHIKVADKVGGIVDSSSVAAGIGVVDGPLNAGPLVGQPDPDAGPTCVNSNATISVWFDTAPTAASGAYVDTVTLTVTPT